MCKRRGFLQKIAYSFLCVGMIEGVFAEALQENNLIESNLLPPPHNTISKPNKLF